MTAPSPPSRRWQLQRVGPAAGGATGRAPHRSQSPTFGDRANAWLRAVAEAWRPILRGGADAAFVAAVRVAEARAEAAWCGGDTAEGTATAVGGRPAVEAEAEVDTVPDAAGRVLANGAAARRGASTAGGAGLAPAATLLALRTGLRRDGFGGAAAVQALGTACAVARRTLGSRPFDSQIVGARALLDGRLAEMATGEGKTLTVALTAAVAALAGVPVHVVTANDYLVARDAAALRPLYAALGLSVGAVLQGDATPRRAAAYACDIACVTAKELVFDHLRDALLPPAERCQRGLHLAIVDEADAILIDEARVPLVLSQAVDGAAAAAALADAEQALRTARRLRAGHHFRLDANGPSARLTPAGQAALALSARQPTLASGARGRDGPARGVPAPGGSCHDGHSSDGGHPSDDARSTDCHSAAAGRPGGDLWRHPAHREHAVCSALAALHGLQRERHYVVREGRVLIVDETTGRVAPGRAWSAGLHTLVELKEGCVPQAPLVTVAQSTYPRFFARYPRLAGLSGTLHDARGELRRAYGLAVRRVPLRLPCRRRVLPHRLFADHAALWQAVAGRVAALHAAGRPVLVATDSVADATALSAVLNAHGLPHACLHAGQSPDANPATDDDRGGDSPAEPMRTARVARDGDEPAATPCSGPFVPALPVAAATAASEATIVARAGRRGAVTISTNMAGRGTDIALDEHARAHGGLHVVCCQLNGARRIDRQLAGRAARQGDDGSVETWLSLDSALLRGLLPHGPLASALWARMPSPLVRLLARTAQRREERCQREQRRRLAAHDRLLQRQLGFGGPSS